MARPSLSVVNECVYLNDTAKSIYLHPFPAMNVPLHLLFAVFGGLYTALRSNRHSEPYKRPNEMVNKADIQHSRHIPVKLAT